MMCRRPEVVGAITFRTELALESHGDEGNVNTSYQAPRDHIEQTLYGRKSYNPQWSALHFVPALRSVALDGDSMISKGGRR